MRVPSSVFLFRHSVGLVYSHAQATCSLSRTSPWCYLPLVSPSCCYSSHGLLYISLLYSVRRHAHLKKSYASLWLCLCDSSRETCHCIGNTTNTVVTGWVLWGFAFVHACACAYACFSLSHIRVRCHIHQNTQSIPAPIHALVSSCKCPLAPTLSLVHIPAGTMSWPHGLYRTISLIRDWWVWNRFYDLAREEPSIEMSFFAGGAIRGFVSGTRLQWRVGDQSLIIISGMAFRFPERPIKLGDNTWSFLGRQWHWFNGMCD